MVEKEGKKDDKKDGAKKEREMGKRGKEEKIGKEEVPVRKDVPIKKARRMGKKAKKEKTPVQKDAAEIRRRKRISKAMTKRKKAAGKKCLWTVAYNPTPIVFTDSDDEIVIESG